MNDRQPVSQKHLHRFYEPLGLLYALGKVRGEHTRKTSPSSEQIDSLTASQIRHKFLDELAFLCDHEKGGDTITAIGLEQTPQGYIYWVAANKSPQGRIVPFLEKLLTILKEWHEHGDAQRLSTDIFRLSVTFAHAKIRTYSKFLLSSFEQLKTFPNCADAAISVPMVIWEEKIQSLVEENPHALVEFAHTNGHSEFMHRLAELARDPPYGISVDSLQSQCAAARHCIGRLGHHARSARALASYTPKVTVFLEPYSVQPIPITPRQPIGRPPLRKATTVEGALVRMLPANAPDLELYQQALAHLCRVFDIAGRFREDYVEAKKSARVHAEVQVLHHFHQNGKEFASRDKYIACSKPACFCCFLYFRHHPGGFVEPDSHHKIYLAWQPPGLPDSAGDREAKQFKNILDLMIKDIRRDALRQIYDKAGPKNFHPDSTTGISVSQFGAWEIDAASIIADDEEDMDVLANVSTDYGGIESDDATASSSSTILLDADSDTDNEEGGISLI